MSVFTGRTLEEGECKSEIKYRSWTTTSFQGLWILEFDNCLSLNKSSFELSLTHTSVILHRNCQDHDHHASTSPATHSPGLYASDCCTDHCLHICFLLLVFLATWVSFVANGAPAQSSLYEGLW
jgi:hypothetical protein